MNFRKFPLCFYQVFKEKHKQSQQILYAFVITNIFSECHLLFCSFFHEPHLQSKKKNFNRKRKNLNNGLENVVMEVGDWLECYWNDSGKI